MSMTKIQRPKIFKLKKNDLLKKIIKKQTNKKNQKNNKKKKPPPASRDEIMIPACAFSMNQSGCRQYTLREGVAYRCQSHVLIACFNYSIAEV